ncbi:MAG: translation initiation factor IF-2 [candidate division WOR-3 bacterium]
MTKRKGPKRVKEIADELGLSASAVISILVGLGYDVKSPQGKVNKEMEDALRERLRMERAAIASDLERKKKIHGTHPSKKPVEEKPTPRSSFQKGRYSGEKRRARKRQKEAERVERARVATEEPSVLVLPGALSVGELSSMMGQPSGEVILKLMSMGVLATVNQTLDPETIEAVAAEFGIRVEFVEPKAPEREMSAPAEMTEPKPPVVAVLGHVDHGKTTLLDCIRKTSIAAAEAGGITQHIGAYVVEHGGYRITFLDTPGHAAFTTIRARGAQGADIVVLVVAANEGVQAQTREALAHARLSGCPIIVAITKIDLPNADPERVKRELSKENLIPEDWGGNTIMVPVSGKTGQGIDTLLDSILVKAEEMRLRTTSQGPAEAVVLESKMERGLGPVATVLVNKGTLRLGDPVVVGTVHGKVRALYNEWGKRVKKAGPSEPVVLQGLSELPKAGDILQVVSDEKEARSIAEKRAVAKRHALVKGEMSLLLQRIKGETEEEKPKLRLIVKADAQGSLEAVSNAIPSISVEDVEVEVVYAGVGVVTEADVALADTVGGMVVAFCTSVDAAARAKAKETRVPIRTYNVIYELLDDLSVVIKGMREPQLAERIIGSARVLKTFRVSGGYVAGCFVESGTIARSAKVRVIRDGERIWDGGVASLKHFQDDVKELREGEECGVRLSGFDKFKEGDILEFYILEEIREG